MKPLTFDAEKKVRTVLEARYVAPSTKWTPSQYVMKSISDNVQWAGEEPRPTVEIKYSKMRSYRINVVEFATRER